MRIYVASSWRNTIQPSVVDALRTAGHDVYDFRNPPGGAGFGWEQIDADWQRWTPAQYRAALQHPLAVDGYASDIGALRQCDACVLVLPSGRSASWEFGYAMGQGKAGAVLQLEHLEPELMYREAAICATLDELLAWSVARQASPAKNCRACAHSYMEPDSGLICGHPSMGQFGLTIRSEHPPLCGDGHPRFVQHSLRNADGTLP